MLMYDHGPFVLAMHVCLSDTCTQLYSFSDPIYKLSGSTVTYSNSILLILSNISYLRTTVITLFFQFFYFLIETESENEFRPLDERIDEFHPKATRTLFIGNLEKTTTYHDLLNIFQRFGEIVVS